MVLVIFNYRKKETLLLNVWCLNCHEEKTTVQRLNFTLRIHTFVKKMSVDWPPIRELTSIYSQSHNSCPCLHYLFFINILLINRGLPWRKWWSTSTHWIWTHEWRARSGAKRCSGSDTTSAKQNTGMKFAKDNGNRKRKEMTQIAPPDRLLLPLTQVGISGQREWIQEHSHPNVLLWHYF